ncbi:MAG TPA: DUF3857 domain-containing protein [Flavipsychrobacter sp.]|nr:DUF3857 domain-containing protein [Flavipsychrobacter sp.]
MKPTILILFLAQLIAFTSYAYIEKSYDSLIQENISKKSYSIDTSAEAVVLYEKGSVNIDISPARRYEQRYTIHKIIKILKPTAFHLGNISIYYRDNNYYHSYVDNISGATYTLVNNKFTKTELPESSIYNREVTKGYYEKKITLSDIKEGSIIEYQYDIVSPINVVFPTWEFQESLPKLTSEFELEFPVNFRFASEIQGFSFNIYNDEAEAEKANDSAYKVKKIFNNNTTYCLWVRHNVKSIKEESYVTNIKNYTERIQIQLNDMKTLYGETKIYNSWEEMNNGLWLNRGFGKKITEADDSVKLFANSLCKADTSNIEKAKAIYNYLRKNFECIDNRAIMSYGQLMDLTRTKRGSVSDINILLTSLLRQEGIDASPSLLSTTDKVRPKENAPLITSFDYVVCLANIDSQKILLDASDKSNPFGYLPIDCYNGYGRIINEKGAPIQFSPDSITEKSVYAIQLNFINDTSIDLSVSEKLGMWKSMLLRKLWGKDSSSISAYVTKQMQDFPGNVTLIDKKIKNLDNKDTNLIIKYTCSIKPEKFNTNYYINSELIRSFKENPFKSEKRELPVEFPYKIDYDYSMNIQLPPNLGPEDLPKPVDLNFEDGLITYSQSTGYMNDLHMISVRAHFQTQKTTYTVDSYSVLRQFFEKMIQEENSVITLKNNGNISKK